MVDRLQEALGAVKTMADAGALATPVHDYPDDIVEDDDVFDD